MWEDLSCHAIATVLFELGNTAASNSMILSRLGQDTVGARIEPTALLSATLNHEVVTLELSIHGASNLVRCPL